MTARNEHTGKDIQTGAATDEFRTRFDIIFPPRPKRPQYVPPPLEGSVNDSNDQKQSESESESRS